MKRHIAIFALLMSALGIQTDAQDIGQEIGNLAPNIEGKDVNSQPLKLSDYRGKVVVLDFWGNW